VHCVCCSSALKVPHHPPAAASPGKELQCAACCLPETAIQAGHRNCCQLASRLHPLTTSKCCRPTQPAEALVLLTCLQAGWAAAVALQSQSPWLAPPIAAVATHTHTHIHHTTTTTHIHATPGQVGWCPLGTQRRAGQVRAAPAAAAAPGSHHCCYQTALQHQPLLQGPQLGPFAPLNTKANSK